MDRILLGIVLAAPFVLGLVQLFRHYGLLLETEAFANEFMAKLRSYIESGGKDSEVYSWLVYRSNKMQRQLGPDGILAMYRPPFANFQYKNFSVILNLLPELRRAFEHDLLFHRDLSYQYAMMLQETMVRHLGSLNDRRDDLRRSLWNPIVWLREGVRTLIALPLSMLGWIGVLSESTVGQITGSRLFRGLSGLASIVGFASAVMGLALGWDEFVQLVSGWWKRFF